MGRQRIGNDGSIGRFNDLALADKGGIRHQFGNVLCSTRRTWIGKGPRAKESCHRGTEQRSYSHNNIIVH
jgi:hypothetical protein